MQILWQWTISVSRILISRWRTDYSFRGGWAFLNISRTSCFFFSYCCCMVIKIIWKNVRNQKTMTIFLPRTEYLVWDCVGGFVMFFCNVYFFAKMRTDHWRNGISQLIKCKSTTNQHVYHSTNLYFLGFLWNRKKIFVFVTQIQGNEININMYTSTWIH